MVSREVWRPRWYAWVLLWLAVLVLAHFARPAKLHGHWLIITPIAVALGVLVLRKLWELPPAVTMCGGLALTIFSGAWHQIGLGGLPFDRLLILTVIMQICLRAPGTAHMPSLRVRNVHLLLALTIIYVIASAAIAGTLTTETGILTMIDRVGLSPYVLFLLAPSIFAGERERGWLVATLVGLGAYLGVTAIFESLGPHSLVFPHYIVRVDAELPGARAGGPFQSSVSEGFATFACSIAALIALSQWRQPRARYFAAGVAVVSIFGCFLTLERGVWIGAVAGTVIAALVTRRGRRWLLPGICGVAVLLGGALALSPSLSSKASTRVNEQLSVWNRQNQTSAGLRMVAARPLLGFGWNTYEEDSLEYFRQSPNYPLDGTSEPEKPLPLHDTYLSYAVELGMVGALLWLMSLLWGVGGAIFATGPPELRVWKLGMLALGIFFLVVGFVDPYQQSFSQLLLWVWAGVAYGSPSLVAQARAMTNRARASGQIAWTAA
jgi:putative inorganic carbon (hco3(-)) transporter